MGSVAVPEVTLYVKAGADGLRPGACPISQAVHMAVLAAEAAGQLHLAAVLPVVVSRPPQLFSQLGLKHVPALTCGDTALDNADEISTYLQRSFPAAGLQHEASEAELASAGVFSRFCFYMKSVSRDAGQLENELQKLDTFLATSPAAYLAGERLTLLDCEVMPKLQHLRVACAHMKGFQISQQLEHVWRYLHTAYTCQLFLKSCPCDQEIVLHWSDRPGTEKLSFERHKALTREKPKYSLDVPAHAAVCNLVD